MLSSALTYLLLARQQKPPFYEDIQAFLKADQAKPPAKGQILFVGSSSFTRWTDVQGAFPTHSILNRGFGGSSLPDVIRYANDVIFPYQPKQVVIYCGENDFAGDPTLPAYKVANRFIELFQLIRSRLPQVPVLYISMKPSPSREVFIPKMLAANTWIAEYLSKQPRTAYLDVYPLMLDEDGRPKAKIFGPDMLHMNADGYAIWTKAIEPLLVP